MFLLDRRPRRADASPARSVERRPGHRPANSLFGAALLVALIAVGLGVGLGVTSRGGKSKRSSTPAPPGPDVQPFPGTPDASALSQIAFSTLKPSQFASLTVTGSSSGRHSGHLTPLAGGRGTAFVPAQRFRAGERVSVVARLSSSQAGTEAGVHGAKRLSFSFTVATPVRGAYPSSTTSTSSDSSSLTQSFHSQPGLHPPTVTASGANPDPDSGKIFVDAQAAPQAGPMILNAQGGLVWFKPLPAGQSALDVRVQSYRGKPVLTYWQGKTVAGHGAGEDLILDSSYQTVATLRGADGFQPDLHEFVITPQDTALYTAYAPVRANLTSAGGSADGEVLDSIVQEVDIKTGQLLWEWHSLGHVPVSASYAGKPTAKTPYDYFHINSIQQLSNGNVLISARNTWAVYEIDGQTGKVIWQLGGKHATLKQASGTNFEWQHDARIQPDGTLTLFDDAASPSEEKQSRALQMALNMKTKQATLVHSYTNRPSVLAGSQGSFQILPDGNRFVGWGATNYSSEFTPSGRQIFSIKFPGSIQSYRAYRFQWSAQPATAPSAAVSASPGRTVVYASWNGATDVARWELLAGSSPTQLSPITKVASSGFETPIPTSSSETYFAVRALGSSGRTLGTSAAVHR